MARGDEVRVFDSFLTGNEDNLADLPDVEVVRGDIRDLDALRTSMRGVERVLHQAAVPSVPRSLRDPIAEQRQQHHRHAEGADCSPDAGVPRVVYRLVLLGVRRYADAAEGRDDDAAARSRRTPSPS